MVVGYVQCMCLCFLKTFEQKLIFHKGDVDHRSCPPSFIRSESFVSHTLALKGVREEFPLEGKIPLEQTYDYIYINGSVSLERCFVCYISQIELFHKEEGHLKLIRVQKYQVLFESLCCAFGLVVQTLMPDAINY